MSFWIDTHCHLDAAELAPDVDAVREQARQAGVMHCVLPAVERANWNEVRTLAHQHGDSYALGIHPLYTGNAADGDLELLAQALAQHREDPRLVAVGEIGLDYFVPGLDPARQEHFYRAQLRLARRFGLPVILHVRRSADRLLKGLREVQGLSGIAHAFNGSAQQAHQLIDLGMALGFGGAMTFTRALNIRRLAASLPMEAIVLETDSPDIAPAWRHPGRNTPAELPAIAQVLAGLRERPLEEVVAATASNARRVLPALAAD